MSERSTAVPAVSLSAADSRRADGGPLPPVALYVHVPFCLSVCPYGDFVAYAGRAARGPSSQVQAYLSALAVELDLRADGLDGSLAERPPLRSVYVGGGTPSLLAAPQVATVLERVRRRYGIAPGAEVTIEANPGPDERGDFEGFAAAGITRVSLGAQSMDDAEWCAGSDGATPPGTCSRPWPPRATRGSGLSASTSSTTCRARPRRRGSNTGPALALEGRRIAMSWRCW